MRKNDPDRAGRVDARLAPSSALPDDGAEATTVLPAGDETLDTLFDGRLRILQSRRGYRFSLDALLLAHFAGPRGREKVFDLGAGSGVVSLILATFYPDLFVTGIEIQEAMVACARRSARLNGLDRRVQILQRDVRTIAKTLPPAPADLVVCNPPYRGIGSGRVSQECERMIARHEIKGELMDFVHAGAHLLDNKGRMVLIFLAGRTSDLLQSMRSAGIEPKRLRFVHSCPGREAGLVMAEGVKGGRREQKVLPPLILYDRRRHYTAEVAAILSGDGFTRDRRSSHPVSPAAAKNR
jgi:tRNA1Val (adenine37-N6)-methyltransferase